MTNNYFYRVNKDGNAVIFDTDEIATRIELDGSHLVYPIDSQFSCAHEHPEGIVLNIQDAEKLNIISEDN